MSQQIQELIEKIKKEGVQAADEKARHIEGQANLDAQRILAEANGQAKQIIAAANAEARRVQESTQMALKQAARDTLLALRQEIETMLGKIVQAETGAALSAEHLAEILTDMIKKFFDAQTAPGGIVVSLNPGDLKALEEHFIAKLQKQIKNAIRLQPADDLAKGFTISFDGGKSCYDFSDASLAQFLSTYLNARVAALVQEAV